MTNSATTDRIEYAALLQELGWTAEDFERAQVYGFPRSLGRMWAPGRHNSYRPGQSIFSREKVGDWCAGIKSIAAGLK